MSKPFLFSIIGAITGVIVSQASIHLSMQNIEIALFAFCLFIISFTLLWDKIPRSTLIKFLATLGIILAGVTLYYFSQKYHTSSNLKIEPIFVFGLIQLSIICTTFFQSWKTSKPHYSYEDLFENAWNNHFYFLFSGLLTGAFLLILGLGGNLFESIGININDIIWDKNSTPVIVGALLGAGIGISREYDQLIFKFRSVFFALFRILAYLTAAIVILFSLVLPFYIETLFADRNTSLILLSIVAVSIVLLNALQDKNTNTLPLWANRIFSLQIILLPILTAVSIYAIYLRMTQYGLMPNRIIAMWAALLIGAHTLGYFLYLIFSKGKWNLGFAQINPPLALLWVISIILLASPILDPVKLSVNDQISRLKSELVKPEKFDFRTLKGRLGEPGKAAIKDIRTWTDHPQFTAIEIYIDVTKADRISNIIVIGEAPKNLDKMKKYYKVWRCNETLPCFIKMTTINDDGQKVPAVFYFKKRSNNLDRLMMVTDLYENKGQSRIYKTLKSEWFEGDRLDELIQAIKLQEPKLIKPRYFDLDINGVKLRAR